MEQLRLSRDHWSAMRAHAESSRPLEACGLLAGHAGAVREVLLMTNAIQSPTRFRMDPVEQIQAFDRMDANGLDLVGIYHSHPADPLGDALASQKPSETDIEEAAYPIVHVIWSRRQGQWEAHGFRIEDGRVSEVELQIGESK